MFDNEDSIFETDCLLKCGVNQDQIDILKKNDFLTIPGILSEEKLYLKKKTNFPEKLVEKIYLYCQKIDFYGEHAFDKISLQDISTQENSQNQKNESENFLKNILKGEIREEQIIEIHGEAGTGKTQFCLNLSIFIQNKKIDKKILYLDTEGGFRPEVIKRICELNKLNFEKVLANIFFKRIFNIDTIFEALEKLENLQKNGNNFFLIIIDSFISLFRVSFINEHYTEKFFFLEKLLKKIRSLCYSYKFCFLLTNHVHDIFDDKNKGFIAVNDDFFKRYCDLRLKLLKWVNEKKKCEIIQCFYHQKEKYIFKIKDKGISRVKIFDNFDN